MNDDVLKKQQGRRLRQIRESARFPSARSAALEYGWPESSYRAHEGGTRTIGQDDAERYAKAFRARGIPKDFTAQWLLFGDQDNRSFDEILQGQPPAIVRRAREFAIALAKKGDPKKI